MTHNFTVNGKACKAIIGDTYELVIENTRIENETTIHIKEFIVRILSFTPNYIQKHSQQQGSVKYIWKDIDKATGNIIEQGESGIDSLKHKIIDGEWEQFKLMSETMGLRLPEHLLNGFLGLVSRCKQLAGYDNPWYIDRSLQSSYVPLECFNQDYTPKQPLVATIDITPNTDDTGSSPNGSFTINILDHDGDVYASVDGENYVLYENLPSTGLIGGEYNLHIKDDNEEIVFTFDLTGTESIG